MKVSVSKPNGNKLDFTVEGIIVEFANTVRRYGMVCVPTFAVDSIVMYENTSSIFDEYLSHRIGLIPLVTPVKAAGNAEIVFVIDEVGPKVVFSSDMKTKDDDVKPAKDKIPVITLNEGQKLRLEAKARIGTGKEHAKFQSGLLSYGMDDDGKFSFKVESFYQMGPKDLMLRACDVILDDIADITKGLKKAK
jgi:DNA-directed RNA polymerase subunit D